MSIDFSINRITGVVTHTWEGKITGKHIHARLGELMQLKSWTFGLNHVIDIRTANFEQITQADILQILAQMMANTLKNAKGNIIGRIAFLTDRDKISHGYEIKLFKLFSTKTKRNMALFYDRASLYQWLNKK